MILKNVVFYIGCTAAWLLVLPVLALAGFIALTVYAVFSQLGDLVLGRRMKPMDNSAAREIARRVCIGH